MNQVEHDLSTRVYFGGFNGVRAIAAIAIIFHHIEMYKSEMRLPNANDNMILSGFGDLSVNLFFVLSGFLITYLILRELKTTGTISISNFYIRRVLRILPLYFLVVALAFSFLPNLIAMLGGHVGEYLNEYIRERNEQFFIKLILFIIMLPNIAMILFQPVIFVGNAWSIGVVEQFYLIWPWIMRYCGKRKWITMVCLIIFKVILLKLVEIIVILSHSQLGSFWNDLYGYLDQFRLESMSFGGLSAYLYLEHQSFVKRFLVSRWTQLCAAPALILLLTFGLLLPFWHISFPFLAAWLLLSLPSNPYPVVNLELPILNWLGKISYGIYMLHWIAIVICLRVSEMLNLFPESQWKLNMVLYSSSILLTIALAGVSFRYFEQRFLILKKSFNPLSSSVRNQSVV